MNRTSIYGVIQAPVQEEEENPTFYSGMVQAASPRLDTRLYSRQLKAQSTSAQLIVGALQAELDANRSAGFIDSYLAKLYMTCTESKKEAAQCVTAGELSLILVCLCIEKNKFRCGPGVDSSSEDTCSGWCRN